jgi:hypothetical protein
MLLRYSPFATLHYIASVQNAVKESADTSSIKSILDESQLAALDLALRQWQSLLHPSTCGSRAE